MAHSRESTGVPWPQNRRRYDASCVTPAQPDRTSHTLRFAAAAKDHAGRPLRDEGLGMLTFTVCIQRPGR